MKKCSIHNCEIKVHAQGHCLSHYKKLVREGFILTKPQSPKFCIINECGLKHKAKGYCSKHYKKLYRGMPFENSFNLDGHSKHWMYGLYRNIITRCYNKNNCKYPRYGGRGIVVCEQWLGKDGFNNFISDMGERPGIMYSIDRIDNNGPYSKENCRWATQKEQQNNKTHASSVYGSKNKIQVLCNENGIVYDSMSEASEKLGLCVSKISSICSGKRTSHKGYSFKKINKN